MERPQGNWIAVTFLDTTRDLADNSTKRQNRLFKIRKERGFWAYLYESIIQSVMFKQKYMHCELVFPPEDPDSYKVLAFGVNMEQGVFKIERTFSNNAYDWIFFTVSKKNKLRLKEWCMRHLGGNFDGKGMKKMYFYPRVRIAKDESNKENKKLWWCSSFVAAGLQSIGLLNRDLPPTALDVDDLYFFIKDHPLIDDSAVPPYNYHLFSMKNPNQSTFNSL
jgi:hypothetical protein